MTSGGKQNITGSWNYIKAKGLSRPNGYRGCIGWWSLKDTSCNVNRLIVFEIIWTDLTSVQIFLEVIVYDNKIT